MFSKWGRRSVQRAQSIRPPQEPRSRCRAFRSSGPAPPAFIGRPTARLVYVGLEHMPLIPGTRLGVYEAPRTTAAVVAAPINRFYLLARFFLRFAQYAFIRLPIATFSAAVHLRGFLFGFGVGLG